MDFRRTSRPIRRPSDECANRKGLPLRPAMVNQALPSPALQRQMQRLVQRYEYQLRTGYAEGTWLCARAFWLIVSLAG